MFTNWLAPPTTTLPPDTIIEVGPPPFTRYAAHSALVSVHSGYLRAALRSENSTGTANTIQIYVPNVTAEQFTPLLTYMYTGFLDLNIDNIFGVLLATHILHMPRALELCRSFLSATQSENYFGTMNALTTSTGAASSLSSKLKPEAELSKVVRPIASKATGIGLNFIAPPTSHILLPSTHTPFKSLSTVGTPAAIVENVENASPPPRDGTNSTIVAENSNSVEQHQLQNIEVESKPPMESTQKRQSKPVKRSSSKPEPIVTTKDAKLVADKGVIIDIASCDGPVRFRRVLNDSYGMNNNNNNNNTSSTVSSPDESKSHSRYMSSSFHQQMVRNINERKQSLALAESFLGSKDENSQDNNQSQSSQQSSATGTSGGGATASGGGAAGGETYNCVYCKHTFKSQYCYQKHAKRHLIPLTLETGTKGSAVETSNNNNNNDEPADKEPRYDKLTHHGAISKREVKPLDMNVQYYPCKTCGSKFPSYYFVHKHRKMCHAEEEIL